MPMAFQGQPLLVSRVAPRLSPGTRRTLSSSPEWHPDCHLERDALCPRLQSGTQTVTWNETHSLLVSRVPPRLSPGMGRIFAAPSSANSQHLAGLRHSPRSQLCHSAWHLEPRCSKHRAQRRHRDGRSQSCPLQVRFGQTSRIGLPHMDSYHANDCFMSSQPLRILSPHIVC